MRTAAGSEQEAQEQEGEEEAPLTDYERERLANIARNEARLAHLGLGRARGRGGSAGASSSSAPLAADARAHDSRVVADHAPEVVQRARDLLLRTGGDAAAASIEAGDDDALIFAINAVRCEQERARGRADDARSSLGSVASAAPSDPPGDSPAPLPPLAGEDEAWEDRVARHGPRKQPRRK